MSLIRVKDHEGRSMEREVLTESFSFGLSQRLLEDARKSHAGRFFLELLAAVDYAGHQGKPVMLLGRKAKLGGFRIKVVIPIVADRKPGPPPVPSHHENGVTRES